MALYPAHEASPAEEYRSILKSHYEDLEKRKIESEGNSVAMAEVRLRLFLSLLDKPSAQDDQPRVANG